MMRAWFVGGFFRRSGALMAAAVTSDMVSSARRLIDAQEATAALIVLVS
jgi:hypothetical protein